MAKVLDGLPDFIPPAAGRQNLAGNHVVIASQDVHVVLAHLQSGSLMVEEGTSVTTGQPLGRVGNSGSTSEPHLHVPAVRSGSDDILRGEGVPILFDGVFATRNKTY